MRAWPTEFVNCHWRIAVLVYPLTDIFEVGSNVLVVGGAATFVSCSFTTVTLFVSGAVMGLSFAALGGVLTFVWCAFVLAVGAANGAGLGLTTFVGGMMMQALLQPSLVALHSSWTPTSPSQSQTCNLMAWSGPDKP